MEAERRHWIPETEVTDGRKPPCGCQGLNLGLLEEQQVVLTTESSPASILNFIQMLKISTRALSLCAKHLATISHSQQGLSLSMFSKLIKPL